MRLPQSVKATLAALAAFLVLLAGLFLAASKLGDDNGSPNPTPSSSASNPAPATSAPPVSPTPIDPTAEPTGPEPTASEPPASGVSGGLGG